MIFVYREYANLVIDMMFNRYDSMTIYIYIFIFIFIYTYESFSAVHTGFFPEEVSARV